MVRSDIWELFRSGDKSAFISIYDSYYQDLYRYGYRLSVDKELTKDCVQQLFMELWERRFRVGKVGNIKGYLLKYLKRKIIHTLSAASKNNTIRTPAFGIERSYEEILIEVEGDLERRSRLTVALSQLSNRQIEIIRLRYNYQLSCEDIALKLSIKKRTVYNQLHSAIKVLRKKLLLRSSFTALYR